MLKSILILVTIIFISLIYFLSIRETKEAIIEDKISVIESDKEKTIKEIKTSNNTLAKNKQKQKITTDTLSIAEQVLLAEKAYSLKKNDNTSLRTEEVKTNKTSNTAFTKEKVAELTKALAPGFKEIPFVDIQISNTSTYEPMKNRTKHIVFTDIQHQEIMKGIKWPEKELTDEQALEFAKVAKSLQKNYENSNSKD